MHRNTEVGVFPVTGHKQCLHCKAAARTPLGTPRSRRGNEHLLFHPAPLRKRELWTRGHLFTSRRLKKKTSDYLYVVRHGSTSPLSRAADCPTPTQPPSPIDNNDIVKGFKRADNCFVFILFIFSSKWTKLFNFVKNFLLVIFSSKLDNLSAIFIV